MVRWETLGACCFLTLISFVMGACEGTLCDVTYRVEGTVDSAQVRFLQASSVGGGKISARITDLPWKYSGVLPSSRVRADYTRADFEVREIWPKNDTLSVTIQLPGERCEKQITSPAQFSCSTTEDACEKDEGLTEP